MKRRIISFLLAGISALTLVCNGAQAAEMTGTEAGLSGTEAELSGTEAGMSGTAAGSTGTGAEEEAAETDLSWDDISVSDSVMTYISENLEESYVEEAADAAKEAADTVEEMADATEESADTVEESADTVEETSDTVEESADAAKEAAESRMTGITPIDYTVSVQYTILDETQIGDAETYDEVMADHWEAYVAAYEIPAQLYSVDGNEDCLVAFVNPNLMNGQGRTLSMDITNGDGVHPVNYESSIDYDRDSGIVYIPSSYLYVEEDSDSENVEEALRIQTAVAVDLDCLQTQVAVSIENEQTDVDCQSSQVISGDSLATTITIPLASAETAASVDLDQVYIFVNDMADPYYFSEGEYEYSLESGKLTLMLAPVSLYSLRILLRSSNESYEENGEDSSEESSNGRSNAGESSINNGDQSGDASAKKSIFRKLLSFLADEVYAAEEQVTTIGSIAVMPDACLKITSNVKAGDYFDVISNSTQYAASSGSPYGNYTSEQVAAMLRAARYVYYPLADEGNGDYISLIGSNTGSLSDLVTSDGIGHQTSLDTVSSCYSHQFYFITAAPTGSYVLKSSDGKTKSSAIVEMSDLTDASWLPLHCTHQSTPLGSDDYTESLYTTRLRFRVLSVDTENRTITFGLLLPRLGTTSEDQAGAAIYRVRYTSLVPVKLAKRGAQSHEEIDGVSYRVYTSAACTRTKADMTGKYTLLSTDDGSHSNTLWYPEGEELYIKEYSTVSPYARDSTVYHIKTKYVAGATNWVDGGITGQTISGSDNWVEDTEIMKISLYKYDSSNGNPLAGAHYQAYTDKSFTTKGATYAGNNLAWTTAADGSSNICTVARPYSGSPVYYYIKEDTSPSGYLMDTGYYVLCLGYASYRVWSYDREGKLLDDSGVVSYTQGDDLFLTIGKGLTFEDDEALAIWLAKTDENGVFLEGAKYQAYEDSGFTIPMQSYDGSNCEWISKIPGEDEDSGSNICYLTVEDRTFYVKETEAPEGYSLDLGYFKIITAASSFQIIHYDSEENMVSDTGTESYVLVDGIRTFGDKWTAVDTSSDYIPFALELTKYDYDTKEAESRAGGTMEGAVFALEFWGQGKDTDEQAESIWYFMTDEEGRIAFNDPDDLITSLTFTSIDQASGACVPSEKTITSSQLPALTTDTGDEKSADEENIADKENSANEENSTNEEESADEENSVDKEKSADEENSADKENSIDGEKDGIVYSPGTYRIREILAPQGYQIAGSLLLTDSSGQTVFDGNVKEGVVFEISRNDNENTSDSGYLIRSQDHTVSADLISLKASAYDKLFYSSVKVIKKGENGLPLEGVTFRLTRNSDGADQGSITTEADGSCIWENLLPGEYTLTETGAVNGYSLLKDSISITVPVQMSESQAEDSGADVSQAYWDPYTETYCFNHVSYTVTNEAVFEVPVAGGRGNVLLVSIAVMMIMAGILFLGRKPRISSY